jgi:glucuronoxylan 4-O-methyltransferase
LPAAEVVAPPEASFDPQIEARARISRRYGLDPHTLDGALLHDVEIEAIIAAVEDRPGGSLLVFGCGNDSLLWERVNSAGRTVFIEHHPQWAADVSATIRSDVVLVSYWTQRAQWAELLDQPERLGMDLPSTVRNHKWDVVFVDGPTGFDDDTPGRMQSIVEASRLVSAGGMVFVHDCERPVEAAYSTVFLGSARRTVSLWGHALLNGYSF